MQLKIDSEEQTKKIATQIASLLQQEDVVFLVGDLGAGKTTFARFLIQALNGEQEIVPSPTFTLVQSYELPHFSLDHYDLYRLAEENSEDDIIELGWEDSLANNVTLVEWPDRLGDLTPKNRLDIHIDIIDNHERLITLMPYGQWKMRSLKGVFS